MLILASGGLTHNLGEVVRDAKDGDAQPHVREFRDWFVDALQRRDLPALFDWQRRAPHTARAHPSPEHLLPLYVALGAAGDAAGAKLVFSDYQLGALSLDAFFFPSSPA